MTEKTINCENCTREYTFEENPKFPRKYCDVCSDMKKTEFEGINRDAKSEVVKIKEAPELVYEKPKDNGVKKENGEWQSTVYNRTIAANSYEVGSAGNRFKLYFETAQDLKDKMQELRNAGLMDMPETLHVTGE